MPLRLLHALGRGIWTLILRWQNWLVGAALLAAVLVGIRCYPHAPLAAQASTSTGVYDASGQLLRLTLSGDDKYRQWLPLAQMPPALVEAVMLHEDAWFRWHPGFNPVSLVRGAWVSYVRGGNRQGGSTLTMQLARLLYRLNTRSPAGKAEQVLRAVWLELRYSKNEILEAYLNYAPYGRNVEGVAAASLVYFGKRPQDLALPEVLTLAVIPQDPTRRLRDAPTADGDRLNRGLRAARGDIGRARGQLDALLRNQHREEALDDLRADVAAHAGQRRLRQFTRALGGIDARRALAAQFDRDIDLRGRAAGRAPRVFHLRG